MDRIRKSVVERHMTLLIVIHRASGFALACFYGFLIGLISITTIWKIMSCIVIRTTLSRPQRQVDFMMKNIYCDMHNQDQLLTYKRIVAEKKKRHVPVNGLY
jgi:hypothetical protein